MESNEPEAPVEPVVEEEEALPEEPDPEATESTLTDWEARAKKLEEKAIVQRERTRTLKERLAKLEKQAFAPPKEVDKTGELDETQLEILELKGITDTEDIDYLKKYMQRNGLTLRETLKDDIALAKLQSQKDKREVKEATPSSTKRSGNSQTSDLSLDIARYEQTGKLPDDFARRSAVINAKVEKENTNKPAWH